MTEPKELIQRIDQSAQLPRGTEERFYGYGVMGLPFASGYILGMRRFPASSVGPGYTSVWHRDPEGKWTFYQDVPPLQACPRYFGSALSAALTVDEVEFAWTGPRDLTISVSGDSELEWHISLTTTPITSIMNFVGSLMPDALWRQRAVLDLMEGIAGVALRAGKLGLAGRTPNGQRFIANPLRIWFIPSSKAIVQGQDLGSVGPIPVQAKLGDFWIPQRGIFAIGRAFFDPFDANRHLAVSSQP